MEQKNILTIKRQQELISINQVLASLVVVLTFFSGYLLAVQESWFRPATRRSVASESVEVATYSGKLTALSRSPLRGLLENSRYERSIGNQQISLTSLESVLWSAQGTITAWGERTVPSYKSAYPFALSVLIRRVDTLTSGWYLFDADKQQIVPNTISKSLTLPEMLPGITDAPAILFLVGPRNQLQEGMTWNEAGGIAQNILLSTQENSLVSFLMPGTYLNQQEVGQLFGTNQTVYWFMPIGTVKEK